MTLKRTYNMRIEITIEEIETDGIVFHKRYNEKLPEGVDFKQKFVRVGIDGKRK